MGLQGRELFLGLSLFEFRFIVFFTLGCGVDHEPPHLQFFQTVEGKAFDSELFLELSLFEFRFSVFFTLGCGVDHEPPHLQFFQTVEGKAPKEAWGGHLGGEGINITFLHPHEPLLSAMRCVILNQIDSTYMICVRSCVVLCLLLHPVLASSFPL